MKRTLQLTFLMLTAMLLASCGGDNSESKRSDDRSGIAGPTRLDDLTTALGPAAQTATAAGCSIETPRMLEASHDPEPDPDTWSSDPPTSGTHHEEWASWGRYSTIVEDKHVIHNLEHGGVALWLGDDTPKARISAIDKQLMKQGKKWIVVPRPGLSGVAAASWGTLLTCDAAAMGKLGTSDAIALLGAWYNATNSKQTLAEARIPAYAGTLEQPRPIKDISLPLPNF
jgi:hypothetical protein